MRVLIFCAISLVLVWAATGHLVLASEVSINISGNAYTYQDPLDVDEVITSGTSSVSASRFFVVGTTARSEVGFAAAANTGSIAAVAHSKVSGLFDDFGVSGVADMSATAFAFASVTLDDLVFTGPNPTVSSELFLDISGFLSNVIVLNSPDIYALSLSNVTVNASLSNTALNGNGSRFLETHQSSGDVEQVQVFENGVFQGTNFPSTVSFGTFTAPVNTPLTLEIDLAVNAGTTLDTLAPGGPLEDGVSEAQGGFGTTVSFPTSGAAFALGAGESVNSVSGQIVDGIWQGTPVSAAVVPLPAGVVLFMSAALLLLPWRVRRMCRLR